MLQSFIASAWSASSGWRSASASPSATSIGGVIGNPLHLLHVPRRRRRPARRTLSPTIPLLLFALFQLKFAIITPALITGRFAERVRFSSYLLFICLFSAADLRAARALDLAPGRLPAPVGRARLRRRHRRAHVGGLRGAGRVRWSSAAATATSPASRTRRRNIPFVILGTGMLWFGWFGFNAGSALAANALGGAWPSPPPTPRRRRRCWLDVLRLAARRQALGDGRLHRRGGRPGGDHPGGRLRHRPRQHRHRRRRQRRQQPRGALEVAVDARRHPRRLPVPRRRRHRRHDR